MAVVKGWASMKCPPPSACVTWNGDWRARNSQCMDYTCRKTSIAALVLYLQRRPWSLANDESVVGLARVQSRTSFGSEQRDGEMVALSWSLADSCCDGVAMT